jgi:hypothetical protein
MLDDEVVRTIMSALEEASDSLRKVSRVLASTLEERAPSGAQQIDQTSSAVARAKEIHLELGPRQAEIIEQLEIAGDDGTTTGVIFRNIGYAQPNVYLTLRGLITLGLAEKDALASPHRYRLSSALRS